MKAHWKFVARLAVLAWLLAACNYPGDTAPTPFTFTTPNATLTAVFQSTATAPTAGGPPTVTPTQFVFTLPTATAQEGSLPTQPSGVEVSATPTQAFATSTSEPVVPTVVPIPIQPTRTTAPVTAPGSRAGVSYTAFYLNDAPSIDGEFDEWTLDRYIVESVTAGSDNWTNTGDLSARAMFGWDEDNLYLAARVRDDRYVQNATEENLFRGDSLEILLDTSVSADYYRTSLDDDDYQLGLSPGIEQPGNTPEAYLWYPQSDEGERTRVKIGAMLVDDGYRVEAQIPWSTFDVSPRSGQHFGFVFSASDNDNSGRDVQQSMVSSIASRILTDPTTWGDLVLSGGSSSSSGSGGQRNGVRVRAPFASAPPSLDGNLADWRLDRYPVDEVTYDTDKWEDEGDLSGSLMAAWDDDFLYLAAEVYDNEYVQNTSGENLFLGDSLEILLDANLQGDFSTRVLNADDYQLGISPGSPAPGQNPDAFLWFPQDESGRVRQVKVAATPIATGYTIEAAIPWNLFDNDPDEGQRFGFVFSLSDNDNASRDVQQSMVSHQNDRDLSDPTTWGELVLGE